MLKRHPLFVLLLACVATQALSQGVKPVPAKPAVVTPEAAKPEAAKPAPDAATSSPASGGPAQGQAADDTKRAADEKRAQAKVEREKEAKARRDQLLSQCVIRPVMSDEDIAKCRAAYAVN